MSEICLEVQGMTKKFGKFTAVDDISFTVNSGEVFGYIGPNGAGKTTTIRVLLGIYRATGGKAEIFGKDVWKKAVEIHKRLAYVPGAVNLWPNLTGGEVIDLFISLKGQLNKERRDKLLSMFELDPTKKCRSYSQGNKQKVALVAALASSAELLILDEPTNNLDPLIQQVFQQCISEQKYLGKAIFLSSHQLSEVEKLCDRVGIIKAGRLVEAGTLSELRHLTRLLLRITTESKVPGLQEISGVYDVSRENNNLCFQVDNQQLGEVIAYISQYGIRKLESTTPSLEDLFLRYYSKQEEE